MFLHKLAISNFLARKTRAALTIAAVALSVSLVVAVTSGYASVRAAVHKFLDQYMGSVDAQVTRKNDPRGGITERVVEALRNDPDVQRVIGRVEIESPLLDGNSNALEGRMAQIFGVERSATPDPRLDNLKVESGQFFTGADGDVAVIDQALAERMGLKLGDTVTIPGTDPVKLKVVGVVRKPDIIAQQIQTMYVPLRTLQRYQGWHPSGPGGGQVNRVTIELARGVNPRQWETRWQPKLTGIDPNLKLKLTRDAREELDNQLASIDMLSYLGGTVSMLCAATFIVFTSLSMGVSERQRSLAMLRAVGAFRSQVGMLVIVEGMALALAGVAIGVPLGWLWVKLLTLKFHDIFTAGVTVSWGGVLFGSVGSMAAALAASALPAWWATRVSPLEAMASESSPPSSRAPIWAALLGLVLIAIDPFLLFGPLERIAGWLRASDPKTSALWFKFWAHFFLGLPGVMIGFFLLAPMFVRGIERLFSWSTGRYVALRDTVLGARREVMALRLLMAVVVLALAGAWLYGLRSVAWKAWETSGLDQGMAAAANAAVQRSGLEIAPRPPATLWAAVKRLTIAALMIAGYLLPPAVCLLGWLGATMLGHQHALLRQQLSSGLWRAAGTCAAMMVGLAVLVVMQVQGNSSLEGWKLPTHFPDIFVITPPGATVPKISFSLKEGLSLTQPEKVGLTFDQQKLLEGTPGIRPGEVMPIAIASPTFGHGASVPLAVALNPDATMFFGIDPHKAFKMMELEFREGSPDNAERMLAAGKKVTLADGTVLHGTLSEEPDAYVVTGIRGDVRRVLKSQVGKTKEGGFRTVRLKDGKTLRGTVADAGKDAIIVDDLAGEQTRVPKAQVEGKGDEPGDRIEHGRYLIVTNEFKELKGMGVGGIFPLNKAAEGPDGKPVKEDYTIIGVVWSPGIDVIVSVFDMGRQFDQRTAASVFGSLRDSRDDFGVERVYLFAANLEWDVAKESLLEDLKKRLQVEGLKAGDVRQIKSRIVVAFRRLLLLASSVAFAAMAVASLGVTNTVMAGIRTRRWQFGVLRAIGVTRGQLLRLVLAEATLLGIVACALGLAAGDLMSVDAHELSRITTGYNPPLAIPWGMVGIGVGIVMGISILASLWPAATVARAEPLALLQAGRAAT